MKRGASSNQVKYGGAIRLCLMEIEDHARCTKQHALTAVKNVKYRSSQIRADQFTVENVGPREDHKEGQDTKHHHS